MRHRHHTQLDWPRYDGHEGNWGSGCYLYLRREFDLLWAGCFSCAVLPGVGVESPQTETRG